MDPLPKIDLHIGDTVIKRYGKAMGLGTVIAINHVDYKDTYGQVLISWDIYGLQTHMHYSLEVVDVDNLCWW